MLLAIWDDGAWEKWAILAGVLIGTYVIVMWVASIYWTYRDSGARSRDPWVQLLSTSAVAVFNFPGLLLYLILRPKLTLAERYEQQLEAEALLHEIQDQPTCPRCRRGVERDFLACPYCGTSLRVACERCSKALAFGWVICPFCGAERQQAPRPIRPQAASVDGQEPATAPPVRAPRPRRASTATYTPPAPKPGDVPAPEPAGDATP
jgi:RNA polymerase subunit RPABC4/transcription elongation factor Spt4